MNSCHGRQAASQPASQPAPACQLLLLAAGCVLLCQLAATRKSARAVIAAAHTPRVMRLRPHLRPRQRRGQRRAGPRNAERSGRAAVCTENNGSEFSGVRRLARLPCHPIDTVVLDLQVPPWASYPRLLHQVTHDRLVTMCNRARRVQGQGGQLADGSKGPTGMFSMFRNVLATEGPAGLITVGSGFSTLRGVRF